MSGHEVTRRDFVASAATAAFGAMIVPRHVLGGVGYQAPSDTLHIAVVGFGGQGSVNAQQLATTERIVAVCDVDLAFAARNVESKLRDREGREIPSGVRLQEQFRAARKYADYREMLATGRDIDAVVVATPDHLHAAVAKAAMEAGKHVYVQKPLTYSVHEARVLREVARRTKVVTQMGNQGHSSEGARRINEWIRAGVIGPVREVHVWTNRPIWPQGIPRPLPADPAAPRPTASASWSSRRVNEVTAAGLGQYPVPEGLRWDLYLGPVAEDLPYHPLYHPFNWRGWTDFGVGAIGDMGAHLIDHPYWALGLGHPTSIEATSTPWGTTPIVVPPGAPPPRPASRPVSYPLAMTVHYEFPARGAEPPVRLNWYDGGLMPPRPPQLPDDVPLEREGGVIFVGEQGILMHETYGSNPRIWPEALMRAAEAVPKTEPRIEVRHETNWAQACKGQATASSPFDYAAPLTETMLLGIAALRAGQGQKILYDAERMRITNVADANAWLTREYRAGWNV